MEDEIVDKRRFLIARFQDIMKALEDTAPSSEGARVASRLV